MSTREREQTTFENTKAYSGVAVHDMDAARSFYGETLGLRTSEEYGLMWLHLAGGRDTLVYEQPTATPADFTILNFEVTRSTRPSTPSPGSRTRPATCCPCSRRSSARRASSDASAKVAP